MELTLEILELKLIRCGRTCVICGGYLIPNLEINFEKITSITQGGAQGWWPCLSPSSEETYDVLSSMNAHGHQSIVEILGDEVGVIEVEQVMAFIAHARAVHSSDNDLLKIEHLL